jgi:hypothetical protein
MSLVNFIVSHRSRTAVAPLERLKILLQVSFLCLDFFYLIACFGFTLLIGLSLH